MSPGLRTERIYKVLKRQIMIGERAPGEHLDPARLAKELDASATPVRDALHQLLGERLVHTVPRQGFLVPIPTETSLRDLYSWTGDLLAVLLKNWKGGAGAALGLGSDDVSLADATGGLFDAIAATLGTSEHRRAMRHASDRLHSVRMIEPLILDDVRAEIARMTEIWVNQSPVEMRLILQSFQRRRIAVVPELIARLVSEDI